MYQLLSAQVSEVESLKVNEYSYKYNFASGELEYENLQSTKNVSSYIISPGLRNAVNAALITGRPLLVKGDPGCGKSKVALAVAAHFHEEEALKYYFEWHVKSKSNAKEGAYTFDHLNRLRDASVADKDPKAKKRVERPQDYVSLGGLGMAFKARPEEPTLPVVLLIDEIDKGDIDFPNDLLLEIDEMRFKIDELGEYVKAPKDKRPLVIITSNNERDLPAAFLRRCLYYKIPPHNEELILKIAQYKHQELLEDLGLDKDVSIGVDNLKKMIALFEKERTNVANIKKPSTSEFLDWLKLIVHRLSKNEKIDVILDDDVLKNMALIKEV